MSAELLTVSEVARRKGVSRSAVYKALSQGRLQGQRMLGQLGVAAPEADAWVPFKPGGRRKGIPMSDAGKARISEGQRRRWAQRKSNSDVV